MHKNRGVVAFYSIHGVIDNIDFDRAYDAFIS